MGGHGWGWGQASELQETEVGEGCFRGRFWFVSPAPLCSHSAGGVGGAGSELGSPVGLGNTGLLRGLGLMVSGVVRQLK